MSAIIIGGESFPSKKAVAARIGALLRATTPGTALAGDDLCLLLHLLPQHPHAVEKLAACLRVVVRPDPVYHRKQFQLEGIAGTRVDFSYRRCIWPATAAGEFAKACRHEVAKDILAFKRATFCEGMACPITGDALAWDSLDVDHIAPDTFAAIREAFIVENGIDVTTITYNWQDGGVMFEDRGMAADWRGFHKRRAKLRLISRYVNQTLLRRTA